LNHQGTETLRRIAAWAAALGLGAFVVHRTFLGLWLHHVRMDPCSSV